MTRSPSADSGSRRNDMLWRTFFIIYGIALTVATHWPRLDLGRGGGDRSPDKMLHFAAFAALTFLLWRAKWIRDNRLIVLIALVWAALDELSQTVAMVERTASWADFVASGSGVLAMGAWLWALAPLGGARNRMRLARTTCATDRVLTSVGSLLWIALGAAIGGAAGLLVVVLVNQIGGTRQLDATLLTVFAVAGAGAHWAFTVLHRRQVARLGEEHACFNCGKRIEKPACDHNGFGECPHCSHAFHIGQWTPVVLPSNASPLRLLIVPVLATLGLLVFGAIAFLLVMRATISVPTVSRIVRVMDLNTMEMMLVADAAYLAIVIAVGTRLFRRRLARIFDRQDKICAACGHDLRATPAELGIGTCGECGTKFVRTAETE